MPNCFYSRMIRLLGQPGLHSELHKLHRFSPLGTAIYPKQGSKSKVEFQTRLVASKPPNLLISIVHLPPVHKSQKTTMKAYNKLIRQPLVIAPLNMENPDRKKAVGKFLELLRFWALKFKR